MQCAENSAIKEMKKFIWSRAVEQKNGVDIGEPSIEVRRQESSANARRKVDSSTKYGE